MFLRCLPDSAGLPYIVYSSYRMQTQRPAARCRIKTPKRKTEHATQISSFTKGKPNISKCKKRKFFQHNKSPKQP
ncbi:unnamed protein product [Meloidogyne enterolobii]|uniref:Uncharacterized protein n=1 Tax=Meloidogyne enterolobii TaxID=390850 RepID=A0ACB0YRA0_MELEN